MFIYNVTLKVDWSIHDRWLTWLNAECIPEMLATGYFIKHQLVRIREVDEEDGPTYAVQYYISEKEDYLSFLAVKAERFSSVARMKWGDNFIQFGTLMEVVN